MIRRISHAEPDAVAALPLEHCAPLDTLRGVLAEARSERALRARLSAPLGRVLRALLAEELRLRPEHIAALVERELAGLRRAREIELRVHPDDARLLEPVEQLRVRLEVAGQVRLIEDGALTRGGCVLISNLGEVDARLETRLELGLAQLAHEVLDEP